MKRLYVSIVIASALLSGPGHADTVIGEVPDTLPGKGFGGLSGFMAGAAAGGPLGALVGAGVGWLGGGTTQDAAGLAGKAYQVERADGSVVVVRSPGREYSPGERVQIVGNRLVADTTGDVSKPFSLSQK